MAAFTVNSEQDGLVQHCLFLQLGLLQSISHDEEYYNALEKLPDARVIVFMVDPVTTGNAPYLLVLADTDWDECLHYLERLTAAQIRLLRRARWAPRARTLVVNLSKNRFTLHRGKIGAELAAKALRELPLEREEPGAQDA